MGKEPNCCDKRFVWAVMALCALVVLVLLVGY